MRKNNENFVLQRSLEEENSRNFAVLQENVAELQSIGIEIKDYITNEKKNLDKLGDSYEKSRNLLDFTMKKIDFLMNSAYGRITCYLIFAVIVVLFVLFLLKP